MQVTVFSTGQELLNGASRDTNAPMIARTLSAHGFVINRQETLGDSPHDLEQELRRAAEDSDVIVLTGGLGPTADDRTRRAVARAAERDLVSDEQALQHLTDVLSGYGVELTESHRRQASFPEGAETFPNTRGTAYGFACPVGDATLVAMPGVPDEMRAMFHNEVLPYLLHRHHGQTKHRKVHLFGISESDVDRRIDDMMEVGRNPSVGVTVDHSVVSVCLHAHGNDPDRLEQMLREDEEELRRRFGGAVFGTDDTTLAGSVSGLLATTQRRIGVAESCTGGEIGSLLVDIPGISRFFLLDVVAYSNEAKMRQLSVPSDLIEAHGAVSAEVAMSMAQGVCEASGADLGISTTGIAGPTGGSPEKPVGLVHFGICLGDEVSSHQLKLGGNRRRIKNRAARHALNFARLALLNHARNE